MKLCINSKIDAIPPILPVPLLPLLLCFEISRGEVYSINMPGPEIEDVEITKEQFDSICARNKRIRNYTFGISSAAGILAGCVYGVSIAKGAYETVLFILFFGCFLGSLFGGIFTLAVVSLNTIVLYIFSPACRKGRQDLRERSGAASRVEKGPRA